MMRTYRFLATLVVVVLLVGISGNALASTNVSTIDFNDITLSAPAGVDAKQDDETLSLSYANSFGALTVQFSTLSNVMGYTNDEFTSSTSVIDIFYTGILASLDSVQLEQTAKDNIGGQPARYTTCVGSKGSEGRNILYATFIHNDTQYCIYALYPFDMDEAVDILLDITESISLK